MGGVAKHLMHLYDDRTLTYNKIKKILSLASSGELEGTEKTDGFNIYLGIKNDEGAWAPAWARNKGDMEADGRTFAELAAREFAGGEKVKKVYVDAFRAYQKAVNSLNGAQVAAIFGENTNIFYNTEIQGPGASNVVNYDKNIISIHHVNHKIYNPETNQLEIIDASKNSEALNGLIDQFEQATSDEVFSIRRTAFLQLNRLQDDYDLNIATQRIQKAGFVGNMTIEEFLETYLSSETERKLNFLSPDIQQDVVDRILEKEDFKSLTQIYKGFPIDIKQRIKQHVADSPKMIKEAIWPIENAIHDFAVELLKGLKSAYILDENNEAELKRLKDEVEQAIRAIQIYQGPQKEDAHQILRDQLEKLKHHDKITTVVEGFVFQVGDQLYKFTGNFAPVNQLLGLFKYGRGKIPPLKKEFSKKVGEQTMEEPNIKDSAQVYAIVPGKFKPPHRGHLDMVKHYADLADKVIVLISPLAKKTPRGQEITAEDSVKIWQIYLSAAGLTNVDTEVSEYNSPVQGAIEYGNDPKVAGSKILLGSSTKGGDAAERFGRNIQKYTPDVEIVDPLKYAYEPVGEELHASDFRTIIDDPEAIAMNAHLKYIPDEAVDSITDIFNIFEASELKEEVNPLPVGIFLGMIEEQYSKRMHEGEMEVATALKAQSGTENELAKLEKDFSTDSKKLAKNKEEEADVAATLGDLAAAKAEAIAGRADALKIIKDAEEAAAKSNKQIADAARAEEDALKLPLDRAFAALGPALKAKREASRIKMAASEEMVDAIDKKVAAEEKIIDLQDKIEKALGEKSKSEQETKKSLEDVAKTIEKYSNTRGDHQKSLEDTSSEYEKTSIEKEKEKEEKETDLKKTQDEFKAQAEKGREETAETEEPPPEPEEELEEVSSMAAGDIAVGMTKSPFTGLNVDKENEEEKKRSKLDDKNKLVKEIYDYLLRAGAH